jgi:hypothetical protein
MLSPRLLLWPLAGVIVVSLASSAYFYSFSSNPIEDSAENRWRDPSLQRHASLTADFNLLSKRNIWRLEGGAQNTQRVSREWSFLGTVIDGGNFALVWRSDVNQIVRVSEGDEIVPGVKVTRIDDNRLIYAEDGKELVTELFSTAKPGRQ